jgi:hypothetical protein
MSSLEQSGCARVPAMVFDLSSGQSKWTAYLARKYSSTKYCSTTLLTTTLSRAGFFAYSQV